MKKVKIVSLLCAAALCVAALCGCFSGNYLEKAAAQGDTYTIAASYDAENRKLSAVQTVSVTNRTENALTSVKFHIYANCYREDAARPVVPQSYLPTAYKNGLSYGDIAFDSVKVDGEAVAYVIEGEDMDILSVPVPEFFPDENKTIEMVYEITLANVCHRLGYGDNTVNFGNFYPVLCRTENGNYQTTPYYCYGDPYVTDVANFDVRLTVPAKCAVACSGVLTEAQGGEEWCTYCYRADAVRDFAFVLSEKFNKISQKAGDVTVNYYYFADETPEATLASAIGMTNFLQEKVAPYPYPQITVAETDFCFGGMEYPNLAMVSAYGSEIQTAAAHEIAHQWFYGLIGNDQIKNAWMDEGLTEFVTMLYQDAAATQSLSASVAKMYKAYTTYVDVLGNYYGKVDVSFRPLDKYKNDSEYVYINYVKGSLLFYTLYDAMGAGKFYKALANYFAAAKMTVAEPDVMVAAFCKAAGSDVSGVFRSFAEGKDVIAEGKE